MEFRKTEDEVLINKLRAELYSNLTAPIDAMWELLYIAGATNYLIYLNETLVGYCSIDNDDCLLQVYVKDPYRCYAEEVVNELVAQKIIEKASLSSNEPILFNAVLGKATKKQINTFCFQHTNVKVKTDSKLAITLANDADISNFKIFLKEQLEMDDTFGYTENLINRKELFLVKDEGRIIVSSECRISDSQPHIADLGIIVHKEYQGNGLATKVLQLQANRVLEMGRKPICSTTIDNIASKKAIERAGFYCSNIIFDMHF